MAHASGHATETAVSGEHDHGTHPPFLAHHFDTPQQQFESGKLGMWVFLATEILMFGGLFCAYSVYRANHPEVFLYAHHYLDTTWGAINTVVLLVSSFTMAWGVRAAQLGQKSLLVLLLALTIAGGGGFMVIKFIEYKAKFEHDLFPGVYNLFYQGDEGNAASKRAQELPHLEGEYHLRPAHGDEHGAGHTAAGDTDATAHASTEGEHVAQDDGHAGKATGADAGHQMAPEHPQPHAQDATQTPGPAAASAPRAPEAAKLPVDHSAIGPAPAGPAGLASAAVPVAAEAGPGHADHGAFSYEDLNPIAQERVAIFFSIYFMMTGLHGIHVVVGMGLIAWILLRALKNEFGPAYFTPVDLVGLYWHLVDLIWIFLFPLLYLIHGQVGS